jgi:hypothetical protein
MLDHFFLINPVVNRIEAWSDKTLIRAIAHTDTIENLDFQSEFIST